MDPGPPIAQNALPEPTIPESSEHSERNVDSGISEIFPWNLW